MKLTKTERLILYSLGHFYSSINQLLEEKPLKLETMKITFIELLLQSGIFSKQERALYKNLEALEDKKLIKYENRMIRFTDFGLKILQRINTEIKQFVDVEKYFQKKQKIKRKMQTKLK